MSTKAGALAAITGPAGSGKDTLARKLAERIRREGDAAVYISGTAAFRAAALWTIKQGYEPEQPLPADAYKGASFSFDGDTVFVGRATKDAYAEAEYASVDAGATASSFATISPDVFKGFVFGTILEYIRNASARGEHCVLGARESFKMARQLPIRSLIVCLSVPGDIQRQRLMGAKRLGREPCHMRERMVEEELARDERNRASGILPSHELCPLLQQGTVVLPGAMYHLPNGKDPGYALEILYAAFRQLA